MKSPSFYQNQPAYVLLKHKKMLDVTVARKTASAIGSSFQSIHTRTPSPLVLPKKRGLDGIHTEKKALLEQLTTRSTRDILWRFFRKTELYLRFVKQTAKRYTPHIAPHKMLYGSLTFGVIFGIVSMGFIERFFGPGVFVSASDSQEVATGAIGTVLGATTDNAMGGVVDNGGSDTFFEYFNDAEDEKYKESIREMVKGYPIEAMLPYIFEQDRLTASFIIGIGKKESNWGKRVPVDEQGNDCLNYWGYRGIRDSMGTGGHTCFNDRQDAVETVAKRINTLIHSNELDTPEKMIIWKCGFSCTGHSAESVRKWIADVAMYFNQAGGGW